MNTKRLSAGAGIAVVVAWAVLSTVWTGAAVAQGFKVIHVCTAAENFPGVLIQAPPPDGNFYGMTHGGGIGFGSVFKMDASGTVTTLHSFAGGPADGKFPYNGVGLLRGTDGYFYGTTNNGGSQDFGTVFRMDSAGGSYLVRSQTNAVTEGASPVASFFQASDGNFYVPMSTGGGINSSGAIMSIDAALNETLVSSFYYLGDIIVPMGHLVQGSNNKLYGVANGSYAPTGFSGGVYSVDLGGGAPTAVHLFAGPDGAFPQTPLLRATDGNFYATTPYVYDPDYSPYGTVFRLAEDGTFATIHGFSALDGGSSGVPTGLIQASDGYLYGVQPGGGTASLGTIYRIDLAGNFTLLASAADVGIGQNPSSELLEAADGKLYGTTYLFNALGGVGTIYTIDLTQKIDSLTPSSGPAAGGTPVSIAGAGFVAGSTVTFGPANATGVSVPDAGHINATAPANGAGTLNHVKVVLPDTTTIILNNGWFADFLDVPTGDLFHDFVRKLVANGITAGCGGGSYCRNDAVKRKQMAVFLLKAKLGAAHVPPPASGTVFNDVPASDPFAPWIEELASLGITGGCGGGAFCPDAPVRRDQMAVFLLKAFEGSAYTPPLCAGIFTDVECAPTPAFAVDWIEELYNRGVTGGCVASPPQYCPLSSVLRGQMSAFLTKTFSLP